MKMIRGFVREDKVDQIVRALDAIGAPGLTVMKACGRGAHAAVGVYRGVPYRALMPICVIDVIASDGAADDIARVMMEHARTGHPGDGHVCILRIDESYAIRTRWLDVA